jgi:hypothetical protein
LRKEDCEGRRDRIKLSDVAAAVGREAFRWSRRHRRYDGLQYDRDEAPGTFCELGSSLSVGELRLRVVAEQLAGQAFEQTREFLVLFGRPAFEKLVEILPARLHELLQRAPSFRTHGERRVLVSASDELLFAQYLEMGVQVGL